MKRTTLIKAVVGAAAVSMLGAGVAYAAEDPVNATSNTTTRITVNANRSLTLVASVGTDYTVSGTMNRGTTGTVLENASATYRLAYVTDDAGYDTPSGTTICTSPVGTDCTNDRVTVRAITDSYAILGATDYITLHVTPSDKTGTGTAAPTLTTADLSAVDTDAPLVAGLNGRVLQVNQSVALDFTADAGLKAKFGTHDVVLRYTIGATPN